MSSLIQFPSLTLAPLQSFNGSAPDDSHSLPNPHTAADDVIGSVFRGAISMIMAPAPGTAPPGDTSGGWAVGRIVAIVLGFVFIAGGIIALTVSKETVINVAKTAAKV